MRNLKLIKEKRDKLLQELRNRDDETGRKSKHGVVYTPDFICFYICENIIFPYLSINGEANSVDELIKEHTDSNNIDILKRKVKEIKVLDPACGVGDFLLAVVDVLFDIYKRLFSNEMNDSDMMKYIIDNNIYGVDIDELSCEISKLNLELKALKVKSMLDFNIKCGNSVITKEFDWEKEFPEVFEQGGFDIVIGNPPYVKHKLITELKPELKKEYTVYHGLGDLYIYFFEKAIKLLKENGVMGFICSNTYTIAAFGKKLRALMLENTILKYTDHTGEKIFNATVRTASIFIKKAKPSKNHEIFINNKHNIKQEAVTEEGFYFDEQSIKFQQIQIKPETNKLEEICYIGTGMRLNASDKYKGEFTKADVISDTKDENHPFEYIEGKDLEQYNIKRIRYLEYGEKTRVPNKIYTPTFKELYTAPEEILTNRVGRNFKATYDNTQLLTDNTINHCLLWKDLKGVENRNIGNITNRKELEEISKEFNPKFIVAILNSPVGKLLLNKIRGINIHIFPSYLKQLPIAKADTETQNKIAEQVDILMDKNASNNAKANAEAIINKTIYEIYELTEEEIAIINQ